MGRQQKIKRYVYGKLKRLQTLPDNQRRAELAQLRRGIGRVPGEIPELWGILLSDMPDEFQWKETATPEEWAIYLALTLYAMHQQGNEADMNRDGYGIGKAVRQLAEQNAAGEQGWENSSVLHRFNALATAKDIYEISHHLRGLIQLLKSAKGGGIPLDYPLLAAQLYGLQCETTGLENISADIKLQWGQDLYRDNYAGKNNEESETEDMS